MCGIAGIIGKVSAENQEALGRMSGALRHRGPDAAGTWCSPEGQPAGCLLAHRRLSILDLSDAANQPMIDHRTGKTLVYNGEVYNFRQLQIALVDAGDEFQTTSDTEVVLKALCRGGVEALPSFQGMFAIALWDPRERLLTLARDPMGIKPLYYCKNPASASDRSWHLMFASELRAILASGLLPRRKLAPSAVWSMVHNGFVMGPNTALDGVMSLFPGETRVFDERGELVHRRRYWDLPLPRSDSALDEHDLDGALHAAVKKRLVSDVPLGVFLSGGIDSSAVANLAQKSTDTQIHTFNLGFEESAYDENTYASAVAKEIGSEHQHVVLTEDRFIQDLDPAISSLDQPTFDALNSYYISKAVREAGFTVALIGSGGDELFGGYKTFRDLSVWQKLLPLSQRVPASLGKLSTRGLSRLSYGASGDIPPQMRWAKLSDFFLAHGDLVRLYQLSYALFLPDLQQKLVDESMGPDPNVAGLPKEMAELLYRDIKGRSTLSALSSLELRCFLGERLLRDTDAASMAVSLEVRVPLIDLEVLDVLAQLRDRQRYHPLGSKALLRRVGLRGLDPRHFTRKKSGFVLPFDRWIRQGLGPVIGDTLSDPQACLAAGLDPNVVAKVYSGYKSGQKGIYWSRIWALYVLVRWCKEHEVSV